MSKNLATFIGMSAILQWSAIVGLLKTVSTVIGADLAVTLMYSLSACILWLLLGVPDLKRIPKGYLAAAMILFVIYELCFSYAIALSQTAQQAIEVSLVNYLWPGLTIVMLIVFKEIRFNFFVLIGLGISLGGILLTQTSNTALNWERITHNIQANPVSYGLAFLGAGLWSLYCAMTKKYSQGHNPIVLFFVAIGLVLWIKCLCTHSLTPIPAFDFSTCMTLLVASCVTALGYAAWNIGMIRGNITLLVSLSYFSPIISTVISMWILQTRLSAQFWHGVILVTLGSFICWLSTDWPVIKTRCRGFFKIS